MSRQLDDTIIDMIKSVLVKHSLVEQGVLFGSRAKGTARNNSDIDIVLRGNLEPMEAEEVALDLDELPLPYKFDVQAYNWIFNQNLKEHINRVGQILYTRA